MQSLNVVFKMKILEPQNRRNAKLFLQSSELKHPHPLTRRRVYSPPPRLPGWDTHACGGKGVGSPNSQSGRGDKHCGTLGLCDRTVKEIAEEQFRTLTVD
jgi:hypothetical protein